LPKFLSYFIAWSFRVNYDANAVAYRDYSYLIKITGSNLDWAWRLKE